MLVHSRNLVEAQDHVGVTPELKRAFAEVAGLNKIVASALLEETGAEIVTGSASEAIHILSPRSLASS